MDAELGVIRIDRLDGRPLATVYNYAVQGLVLGPENLRFSADLVGEASRIIEQQSDSTPLFCNGAQGDVRPSFGEDETALREGGARLGEAVLALRADIAVRSDTDVQSSARLVDAGPSCAGQCQHSPWLAPSSCALERVFSRWGSVCHHVELGVSRFIPSRFRPSAELAARHFGGVLQNVA